METLQPTEGKLQGLQYWWPEAGVSQEGQLALSYNKSLGQVLEEKIAPK